MAIKTSSLVPFNPTSVPDRLTALWVTDATKVTTTTGTQVPANRINRVQSASFTNDTGVIEVSEMGTQNRIGGVDDLGEVKFKLDFNGVGMTNIANLTGTAISTTSGVTTTIGLTAFQSASVDIFRFVADKQNNVYGTFYIQDAVIEGYDVDVKSNGLITESISGMAPNGTYFPGFIVPKTYVALAADIVGGVFTMPLSSVLGADEQPVAMFLPAAGSPPSYWQQNGSKYFFKIEVVPGAVLTANPVRYYEAGHVASKTVTYTVTGETLAFPASAVAAGDLIRIVYMSYNTDSFPTAIPYSTPDTADRPGVHSRLIPVTINGLGTTRITSAAIKFSLKRDHVNGIGENTIIYGVPSIPDVTIDMEVKESDPAFLALLATGADTLTSNGGTIASDFAELSYITRKQLATAFPFTITLNDPFDVSKTLVTYSTPQIVVKSIDFNSSNKADNTLKISAMDIQGILTASHTAP